jgi:acid phosphatase type 7
MAIAHGARTLRMPRRRVRLGMLLAGVLILLAGTWLPVPATASTIVAATEDSYVSAERPTSNYGSATRLRADGSPDMRAFVKFVVTSHTGVSKATLRIRLASVARNGLSVNVVDAMAWSEFTLTATNAPPSGQAIAMTNAGASDSWVSLDVTKAVTSGARSFVISSPNSTAVAMWSRESSSPPELVIESGTSPTSSTSSTSSSPSSSSGSPPSTNIIRAAFYYPWFPEAWKQAGFDPFTYYEPTLGYYSQNDADVLAKHVAMMRYAHLNTAIASWWGQGTRTDGRITPLLSATAGSGLKTSLYYEVEGSSDPSVSQLRSDLAYIRDRYSADPAFLSRGGKPLIFVYSGPNDACGMVDRWTTANSNGDFQIVLKVFPGYRNCSKQPHLWHQYSPAVAEDEQRGFSYAVSPGFHLRSDSNARLSRDLPRFRAGIRAMVESKAPLQLVTTFNEWGEGTSVEPATQWSSAFGQGDYLDALREVLPDTRYVDSSNNASGTSTTASSPSGTTSSTTTATSTTTTAPSTSSTSSTPSTTPGPAPIIAAAGDIACDPASPAFAGGAGTSTQCRQAATAQLLDPTRLSAVLVLGDSQYEQGTLQQFQRSYDLSWGKLKGITRPAVGNHEYLTAKASGYFDYFGASAGDPAKGYYSWNVGSWHMIVINSNCSQAGGCGKGSPQETWLRADLKAHPTACTLAYWHHPRFSSGQHGDFPSMTAIWQALVDEKAEVVLAGHDHDYERFAPMLADGTRDAAVGVRQFVVGTGGKNLYEITGARSNSEVRSMSAFGVLEMTLNPTSYDWKFVPASGSTFTDQGSAQCH